MTTRTRPRLVTTPDAASTSALEQIAEISGDLGTGVEALQEVIDLMLQEGDGGRFRLLQCVQAQLTRSWREIERACREAGAHTATES